ncbi:carbohydrate ABC transporter membrane protein 2, CUT1 family (TC 3.A.1.1.-) [Paenibacillus sp. 1_12]|uniref:carbohydrate ABC transporter permease n=1 Tax=Paenibacillus sp. 1_12 TaxID=1566278 RepID=UPI0008EC9531|nr:carbohydrate ABC transporter permease [Paenibacillus sp. 1_12]SFL25708.1 carbohydrate ABC transporter membrane protein 2, CUT1 family (TC 3.A.1.1.-) [Paenibacillus sp. 1_12]
MPVGEKQNIISRIIIYILLAAGAFVSAYPFYWMLVISTRTRDAVYQIPPAIWPGPELVANFSHALERIIFFRALWNSFIVSGATTVSVLFFCSLAGFAFAKFEFPGKKLLFVLVLGTLLVPQQLSVLPNYILMAKLSWIDSYKAIIVPSMVSAFGIFWMRQYITASVHTELLEASRIDGSGYFNTYWRIVLPIIVPALATLGIFTFLNTWNDFFWPLVVLKNNENFTIQIALQQLFSRNDSIDYGMIMSATFFATLPLLIVFALFSRWFISGLTSGAVKS